MGSDTGTQECSATCCHAHSNYCIGQSELKGEDVVFVEHRRPWPGSDLTEHSQLSMASSTGSMVGDLDSANVGTSSRWLPTDFPPACPQCGTTTNTYSLYCVFDGHNGVHAAKLAGDAVLPLVESKLPLGTPPPVDHHSYAQFREGIQLALVEAIVEMNHLFAQRGIHAGATATVVLQHGWLVTAAGLGDSRTVVDTGYETMSLSADHRVASHKGERRRVEAMGGIVAPLAMWGTGPADDYSSGVGPLRIWPGGLAISRAIGDFDVGEAVLPFPHVTQVLLPPTGGRLLVASDGIWDAFDKMSRAGGMSRSWSTEAAPTRMIQTIVRAFGGLKDDTTLVVADILPAGMTFPQVASAAKKAGMASNGSPSSSQLGANGGGNIDGSSNGGILCGCFGGSSTILDDSPSTRPVNPSINGGTATFPQDLSVRSYNSNASASIRGGKPCIEVLASVDVAGIMGLMPEPELVVPGWYTAEVGERLFRSASHASDTWNAAHNKRYARPPATLIIPEVERVRRKGRKGVKSVAFDEDSLAKAKENGTAAKAGAANVGGGGVPRSASMHFLGATVDSGEDFASKFGHYTAADGDLDKPVGGFLAEASVRAGRVYNSEASVRAGKANSKSTTSDDPSVRLRGSNLNGSVHIKKGKLMTEDDLQGLAPVRVVKRTGSSSGTTAPAVAPPTPAA